ncbi:hypothetical protein P691DRAFT_801491 [Macrolepiota fuliginosa MF-IS2]|uniref:Uncharacterized protein n=1 Tax=Macrolepiota fuliginosa MF-IS2 TaxID=1400762 RepID=A0A9P5XEC2_9AGAR|nr:hypothetical protein P691DRAFT_801491 [Macrolepiota fuliginosa MF-IS2]
MNTNLDKLDKAMRVILPGTIADATGALFTGACLTLSTMCLVLLSSENAGPPKQRHWLRAYIVVLVIAVVGFFLSVFFFINASSIFFPRAVDDNMSGGITLAIIFFLVTVIYMTDGILVWRCYMVHNALMGQSSSLWGRISWVIPPGLWIVNFVTGIITCATGRNVPTAVLFITNALVNIYGTTFIIIRILQHRRMARVCFGDKVPIVRYHSIMGVLLESAMINVPIATCAAVGYLSTGPVSLTWIIVIIICTPSQAFATLLVIHRVALGRAIGQHSRKEVVLSMEKSKKLTTHNVPLLSAGECVRPWID